MSAPDVVHLSGAFLAGLGLGVVFFGGLWLTIRQALSSPMIGVALAGSFMLRTGLVLWGFFAVSAGDWRRLLGCFLGFFLARMIVQHRLRVAASPGPVAEVRGCDAP